MTTREFPTEQTVIEGSVQLQAGQKFHHRGGNGVPYFRLEVKGMPNGDLYPVMSTPDAASVLPLVLDEQGKVLGVYMLVQKRPETEGVVIKVTGNYCNLGESRVDGAIRSLKKIGIVASKEDLIECGELYGYGDQYNFPVSCFVLKKYKVHPDTQLPEGCMSKFMTLSELATVHARNGLFGDETAHLLLTVMMRNQFPDLYSW